MGHWANSAAIWLNKQHLVGRLQARYGHLDHSKAFGFRDYGAMMNLENPVNRKIACNAHGP